MTELRRSTATLAVLAFAALNALAWVAGLRVLASVLPMVGSPLVLGSVAAATGLAVPLALGALRLRAPAA